MWGWLGGCACVRERERERREGERDRENIKCEVRAIICHEPLRDKA